MSCQTLTQGYHLLCPNTGPSLLGGGPRPWGSVAVLSPSDVMAALVNADLVLVSGGE